MVFCKSLSTNLNLKVLPETPQSTGARACAECLTSEGQEKLSLLQKSLMPDDATATAVQVLSLSC